MINSVADALKIIKDQARSMKDEYPVSSANLMDAGLYLASEIEALQYKSGFLDQLHDAGVDNWQGYEIAQQAMEHV